MIPTTAEQRLCAAVVNQCIRDCCMTPLGSVKKAIRPVAKQAFIEFFYGRLDCFIEAAGLMPGRFKSNLFDYMWSARQTDEYGLYTEQRRACFRWNAKQVAQLKHVQIPNMYRKRIGESY